MRLTLIGIASEACERTSNPKCQACLGVTLLHGPEAGHHVPGP